MRAILLDENDFLENDYMSWDVTLCCCPCCCCAA